MANTKILISENDEIIARIEKAYEAEKKLLIDKINNVIIHFSEFDETFSDNGMTAEKYNQLISTGPIPLINAKVKKITDQLEAAGITLPEITDISTQKTIVAGDALINAFDDMLSYLSVSAPYPELKLALSDIEIVNGWAAVKAEKNIEPLKDRLGRNYFDTDDQFALLALAESLATILNSINVFLRSKNIYNITELNEFGDLVKYKRQTPGADEELEVNLKGIFDYGYKLKNA